MSSINIVYEDDRVMVVEKPAGMLVTPAPGSNHNTLTDQLNKGRVGPAVHPCHRIDMDTSGLILYAKGKGTQEALMEDFKQRRVKKSYIAFVNGRIGNREGAIELPIEGKRAVTKYRLTEQRKDFAVLDVEPVTGRTNQIRIHLKAAGHPLVGERKFAFAKDFKLKFRRAALHSHRIEFPHPGTGEMMSFVSPMPDDMKRFLEENK
ncbi:MAG: RluA family pseudouridine synthase [Candidatus Omnitrophota bacterium]|jgi:23S rRNA pseudouridine1911/1915/1917 synthase